MSREKNHPIVKRMKQLHIPTSQIAHHVMLSLNDLENWIAGENGLSYVSIFRICELLDVDYNEVLKWELDND